MKEKLTRKRIWDDKVLRKGLMYLSAIRFIDFVSTLVLGMFLSLILIMGEQGLRIEAIIHPIAFYNLFSILIIELFLVMILKPFYKKAYKIFEIDNIEYLKKFD